MSERKSDVRKPGSPVSPNTSRVLEVGDKDTPPASDSEDNPDVLDVEWGEIDFDNPPWGRVELSDVTEHLRLDEEAAKKGCFLVSMICLPKWPKHYEENWERTLPAVACGYYESMRSEWKWLVDDFIEEHPNVDTKNVRNRVPTTICAMFAHDAIIISSSARKAGTFIDLHDEEQRGNQLVVQALQLAGLYENKDKTNNEWRSDYMNEGPRKQEYHRHEANCAEALTLHLWSVANRRAIAYPHSFKMVTVTRQGGKVQLSTPCSPSGCADMLYRMLVQDVKELPEGDMSLLPSELHAGAELSDEPGPQHSITESSVGKLWLSCGAQCNGTGQFLKLEECRCTFSGWYSAWHRNVDDKPPYAVAATECLSIQGNEAFVKLAQSQSDRWKTENFTEEEYLKRVEEAEAVSEEAEAVSEEEEKA